MTTTGKDKDQEAGSTLNNMPSHQALTGLQIFDQEGEKPLDQQFSLLSSLTSLVKTSLKPGGVRRSNPTEAGRQDLVGRICGNAGARSSETGSSGLNVLGCTPSMGKNEGEDGEVHHTGVGGML